jgi:hypothetical protein
VSAESIGQTAFLGVAWPQDAKPTHPGAAGGTVDPNWAKTLPREAGCLYAELKSERQNGNSGIKQIRARCSYSQVRVPAILGGDELVGEGIHKSVPVGLSAALRIYNLAKIRGPPDF